MPRILLSLSALFGLLVALAGCSNGDDKPNSPTIKTGPPPAQALGVSARLDSAALTGKADNTALTGDRAEAVRENDVVALTVTVTNHADTEIALAASGGSTEVLSTLGLSGSNGLKIAPSKTASVQVSAQVVGCKNPARVREIKSIAIGYTHAGGKQAVTQALALDRTLKVRC